MKRTLNRTFSVILSLGLISAVAVAGGQKKGAAEFKKLGITDLKKGKGRVAKKGDAVTVLYIGKFKDGKVFDSNMDAKYAAKGPSFDVHLGAGGVIKGWDLGLVGTQEGTIRKLEVPSKLAYGEQGYPGAIPPNTDLIFIVKVLKVTAGK